MPTLGKRTNQPSESAFDQARFLADEIAYAPIYTWMWNGRVTREETDRRLEEMRRIGIRRAYVLPMPKSFRPTSFPTPLEPDYLSDGYFEAYRYAAERAKALGMDLWLYDEGGWPSGGACGQVMLEDPSLVQETVRAESRVLKKGEPYRPSDQTEIAFLRDRELPVGTVLSSDEEITEYRRVKSSFPRVASADYPDVTKRRASESFFNLTHDRYQAKLGDLPEQGFTALFTDEPTAPRPFPYTEEIKEAFLAHFGERIEGYLPLLTGKVPATRETAKIKIGFYRMMGELFRKRVLEKGAEKAHRAGLDFVGHLDKDDEANGSMTGGNFGLLAALRTFDVPGVDAIRRQIFPPKGKRGLHGENKFFPRLASSAAAQSGGRYALTESFAVYGAGLSYDEMRYVLNFQAMRGVNRFNLMIVPYGREGYLQAGLLPHFTEALYPDLSAFNRYATRLSYLFSLGERKAEVALYYPVEDGIAGDTTVLEEYEAIGKRLEEKHIPFDLIDDEFLLAADRIEAESGVLAMGRAQYRTVILPCCGYLSDCAIRMLRTFRAAGGSILTTSPDLAEKLGATYTSDFTSLRCPLNADLASEISYAESTTSDGKIVFLMNEGGESKTLLIPAEEKVPYLLRLTDGKILLPTVKEGKIEITAVSGEILCLLYTDRDLKAEPIPREEKTITLVSWTYRRVERLVIGERTERIPLDEAEAPVTKNENGFAPGFSGSVLYRTTFSLLKDAKSVVLDLGETEGAASLSVNGVPLGVIVMPPYRYSIPSDLLQETNTVTVLVTNTAANEYARTDAFDRYRPWQLGNYYAEEKAMLEDAIVGGIRGDTKIFYE